MKLDFDPQELDRLAQALAPVLAKELKPLLQARGTGQDGDKIFDIDGLAEYLKVKKTKIYELTHLKAIPCFRVGRFPRFKKADIDLWLKDSYTPAVNSISNSFQGGVAK